MNAPLEALIRINSLLFTELFTNHTQTVEKGISSVNYPVSVFIITPSVMARLIVRTALMKKIAMMNRVICNLIHIFLKSKCSYVRNALFQYFKVGENGTIFH